MVATRVSVEDIRFLLECAASDPDYSYRHAALEALAALPLDEPATSAAREVAEKARGRRDDAELADQCLAILNERPVAGSPPSTGTSLDIDRGNTTGRVRRAFAGDEELPELSAVRSLDVGDVEDLLTDLVEILLAAAIRHAPPDVLRRGSDRLAEVVRAVTHNGARPVSARLPDPGLVMVPAHLRGWAGGLLAITDPRELLAAGRLAVRRENKRLVVLRGLAKAASLLGVVSGDLPELHQLVEAGYPRPTRGARAADTPAASDSPGAGTRTAYARFEAPHRVLPAEEFEVRVGLARSPSPGTREETGLDVPDESFTLTVELVLDGFVLQGNMSTTRVFHVSAEDPYPYEMLRVIPGKTVAHDRKLTILAMYYVAERRIGIASREILVSTRDVPAQAEVPDTTSAVDWVLDTDAPRPDLEILVLPGNDGRSMVWHYRSRHAEVGDSAGTLHTPMSDGTAATMRRFTTGIERRASQVDLEQYTNGVAAHIGRTVHDEVWQALARAAKCVDGPPSVLLATWDPHLPWELARVPVPWLSDPAKLGAQAIIGRWPYFTQSRSPAPAARLNLSAMAVVSGVYPGANRLKEAEAEAEYLTDRFGAVPVTPLVEDVLGLLQGATHADLVHMAVHGKFDVTGTEDGIRMIDGKYLSPVSIAGLRSSEVRFAFLNACQLAGGSEVFGEYGGMAASLLEIGAMAVIAPLWKVDDAVARSVAEDFYPAVLARRDRTPAEFLREQRCATRGSEGTAGSTRLAYVFFGHPLLRISWEGKIDD